MSWNEQVEPLIKSAMESQQKLWNTWTEAVQGSTPSGPVELWQNMLTTWRRAMDAAWEMQGQFLKTWSSSTTQFSAVPKELSDQAEQARALIENWTRMQRESWDRWLAALQEADPEKIGQVWQTQGGDLMKTVQENTEKMIALQQEAFSQFTAKLKE